ncbi:10838_t:CDS:2, partial [Cetraspora pellucida]
RFVITLLRIDFRSKEYTASDLELSDLFANQIIDQDSDLVNRLSRFMKKNQTESIQRH